MRRGLLIAGLICLAQAASFATPDLAWAEAPAAPSAEAPPPANQPLIAPGSPAAAETTTEAPQSADAPCAAAASRRGHHSPEARRSRHSQRRGPWRCRRARGFLRFVEWRALVDYRNGLLGPGAEGAVRDREGGRLGPRRQGLRAAGRRRIAGGRGGASLGRDHARSGDSEICALRPRRSLQPNFDQRCVGSVADLARPEDGDRRHWGGVRAGCLSSRAASAPHAVPAPASGASRGPRH